ncbi:hypothetical protein AVDCRST_MAG92-5287 [uncultured Coleofasciculus sp.]|uniref:Uncharacterized protein n=1 Tax=uncultured Coleofasciculus sp. TaxID=1267456 RepID=A0A6J4KDR0_9CYAN|nr:hypothetical protein AVDCRST_MAG92-5287 [uncultured Coleofasciculus sp.]
MTLDCSKTTQPKTVVIWHLLLYLSRILGWEVLGTFNAA